MKLESSQPGDAVEMVRWMTANRPANNASLRSLKGCKFFKIAGIFYLPVKPVLMLESLAPNPEVTGKRRLLALRRAMNDLRKMYPHTEIIFLTKGTDVLDEAAKFYGFDELPYKVFRMRPDDKSTAAKAYRAQVATEEVRAYA